MICRPSSHSVRRDLTGFAREALIDWKLTVTSVISRDAAAVPTKIQTEIVGR